jgi:hypothetical protein
MMNPAAHNVPVNFSMSQRGPSVRALVAHGQELPINVEQPDHLSTDVKHLRLARRQISNKAYSLKHGDPNLLNIATFIIDPSA